MYLKFIRQVAELHLDERFNSSKEAIGKQITVGQQRVSTAFNNLWTDIEPYREAQRLRQKVTPLNVGEKNSISPKVRLNCGPWSGLVHISDFFNHSAT